MNNNKHQYKIQEESYRGYHHKPHRLLPSNHTIEGIFYIQEKGCDGHDDKR